MTPGTYVQVTPDGLLSARLEDYRGQVGQVVGYENLGACPLSRVKFPNGDEASFTQLELRAVVVKDG